MNYTESKSTDKLALLLEHAKGLSPEILGKVKSVSLKWHEVHGMVVPIIDITLV